jgi:hypothetical protein
MEKLIATTKAKTGAGKSDQASTTREPRFHTRERPAASPDK